MPKAKPVILDFSDAPKKQRTALMSDVSAITRCGDDLFIASDEGTAVERLSPLGKRRYGGYTRFELGDFVELKADASIEIDIEGLGVADGYLWLTGSHSLKRRKPADETDASASIECLADIVRETNRFMLARIPYELDDEGRTVLRKSVGEGKNRRTAAQLRGTSKSNMLLDALRDDEHIAPFLAIPAKENGFDIEGLSVMGSRIFLGLRGPVLRGWAIILELHVEDASPHFFRLLPIGKEKALYRKHFLNLGGLGVREICHDGDDLLILAGPTMDLEGRVLVRRWKNVSKDRKESVVRDKDLVDVLDVPYDPQHSENAEGLCLFEASDTKGLLVVYDSPAKRRMTSKALQADFFPLT